MKYIFLLAIIVVLVSFYPHFVYAEGLVPCTGIDCSFCDLFSLAQNIFNFVVWDIVPVLATIMILWSGFVILTARDNPANVQKGRKMITATLIGIVLVYSSYILASFVVRFFAGATSVANSSFQSNKFLIQCTSNPIPDVTGQFKGPFEVGEEIQLPEDVPAEDISETETNNLQTYKDADISGLNSDVGASLRQAARSAMQRGTGLLVTDGRRTLAEQNALVAKNCTPRGATKSSDCRPETCIPVGDGSNCRHTTGKAVDVWGFDIDNSKRCCQDIVKSTMGTSGFCVLKSEAWHFELKSNLIRESRTSVFDCSAASGG